MLSFPAVDAGPIGQSALIGDILIAFETLRARRRKRARRSSTISAISLFTDFCISSASIISRRTEAEAMEALETRALARAWRRRPLRRA